jgi:hypothetical protein
MKCRIGGGDPAEAIGSPSKLAYSVRSLRDWPVATFRSTYRKKAAALNLGLRNFRHAYIPLRSRNFPAAGCLLVRQNSLRSDFLVSPYQLTRNSRLSLGHNSNVITELWPTERLISVTPTKEQLQPFDTVPI